MAGAERRGEEGEEPTVKTVIPVSPEQGSVLVDKMRSRLSLPRARGDDVGRELLEEVVDIAQRVSMPWLTDSGIAVTVEPEGFKHDVKRKLVGSAELLAALVSTISTPCLALLDALEEEEDKLREAVEKHAGDVVKALGAQASLEEVALEAIVAKCIPAIRVGLAALHGFTISIDMIMGAVQLNVPASIMPNAHKIRLGVMTD